MLPSGGALCTRYLTGLRYFSRTTFLACNTGTPRTKYVIDYSLFYSSKGAIVVGGYTGFDSAARFSLSFLFLFQKCIVEGEKLIKKTNSNGVFSLVLFLQ